MINREKMLKHTWYYGVEIIGQTGIEKNIQSHHNETAAEGYSRTRPQIIKIHSFALQIQHQSLCNIMQSFLRYTMYIRNPYWAMKVHFLLLNYLYINDENYKIYISEYNNTI